MNKLLPLKPARNAGDSAPHAPRFLYADQIRIAAMAAVVVLHVSAETVMAYGRIGPWQWLAGNLADSASRWGVPVFAMLSGALLLGPGKNEAAALFLSKRMRRILVPLLFWSLFSYAWYRLGSGEAFTPGGAVRRVVLDSHMYYLFILAGLYGVTPWLRQRRGGGWSVSLSFLAAGALNAVVFYFSGPAALHMWRFPAHFFFFAAGFVGYYTAGQLLAQVPLPPRMPACTLGAAAASSLLTAAGTAVLAAAYWPGREGLYLYDYFSPTVVAASFAVFMSFRSAAGSRTSGGGPSGSTVRALADASFGVYLMHPFIQEALRRGGEALQDRTCLSAVSPWIGIPFFSAAVYGICVVITIMIRRTPYLRAVVGG